MSVYLRGTAVSVVLTVFLGVGCGPAGSSDADSPAATYDLAVFPGDFPESESHWPAGEPIIAECWSDTSHVTVRTRAGERFAFTTALPPELLELDGTIRQASRMFPDDNNQSRLSVAVESDYLRRLREIQEAAAPPYSRLRGAVERAAIAACR